MEFHDVIIIGGGHNGLTAAAYLSMAGKRVLVLEQRDVLGGFCTTEETVSEAPGFKMNPFAADHVLTNVPPGVDTELDLAAEGLRWVRPDPFYSYLDPEGESIAFWRDPERTISEIQRFSPRDAEHYRRFNQIMTDLWITVVPYLQGHPTRVSPRSLAKIVINTARRHKNLAAAARMLLASPGTIIEEWFSSPQLRAALAAFSVATMSSLDEPGTGIILAMMAVQHRWGVRRPIGGNGSFSSSLAARARRHGTEIRTEARVAGIDIRNNRATGVTLADGQTFRGDQVLCTLDPYTLAHSLLPPESLPEHVYDELRGMSLLRNNISAFKADIALSRRLQLVKYGRPELLHSVMLMAPSLEYVRRSTAASLRGELTDEVPLWLAAPSVLDRTLVPRGSDGETLYLYLPAVPYSLAEGDWSSHKNKHLARCLTVVEAHLPGTCESIIGAHTTSPADLEAISGLHRGHLYHVDMTLSQFGPWRPVPSLSAYRTPIDGLLHAGAGAHPMGTLSGWSGRTAAGMILRRR